MKKVVVLALTWSTLGALAVIPVSCRAQSRQDPAAELLAADRAFSDYSAREGFQAAFAAIVAEDVVTLPARHAPRLGKDSVVAGMAGLEKYTITWVPGHAEVSRSGDLGYTYGKAVITEKATQRAVEYTQYVTVWRREGKVWKVICDIGNEAAAPMQK